MEAELVSALTELRRVRRVCKNFKEEIKNLENELHKSNKLIERTGIMIIDLKLKTKEARVTEEALNNFLVEKDKENESVKLEVVSLIKKVQENNTNDSSKILKHIISNERPTNDKTGIGYKYEVTNASTSTSTKKTGTYVKNTNNQMESVKQRENQISTLHRRSYDRHHNKYNGYCFFCYKHGHKDYFCNAFQET